MTEDDDTSTVIAPIVSNSYVWYSRKTMHIPITLHMNGRKVETIALIDSGATGIFIDRVFTKEHNLCICNLWKEIAVMNVDGMKNQDGFLLENT